MEIKNKEFFTEIKYQIEKLQIAYSNDRPKVTQLIAEFMYGMIQDYEDANNDKNRLVREIDVILCGKDAAIQASLCDLVNPIRELKNNNKELLDCIHNLMAVIDSPVGRRQIKGDFADEARKIGRDILEKNNINLYGQ